MPQRGEGNAAERDSVADCDASRSTNLHDTALPARERSALNRILERYRAQGIDFHALRTRQAGARSFVSVHVLVPAEWSVARGHDMAHAVERDIREVLPGATVLTHIEPLGHPESYRDIELDC